MGDLAGVECVVWPSRRRGRERGLGEGGGWLEGEGRSKGRSGRLIGCACRLGRM